MNKLKNISRAKNGLFTTKPPKYEPLLKYKEILDWLDDVPSEVTQRNYLYKFYPFLQSTGKTPKTLLELDDRELKLAIKQYLNKKIREEKKGTVATVFTAIRSFLRFHDRVLKWGLKEKRKYGRHHYVKGAEEHIPSLEEVWSMVDIAQRPRDRAILITLFQSGVRNQCLRNFDWKLVKDRLFLPPTDEKSIEKCGYLPLRLTAEYDNKTTSYSRSGGTFITFLHVSGALILRAYLKDRMNRGWEPKDSDKLFITEGQGVARSGNPLSKTGIWRVVNKYAEAIGIDREKIWTHLFRKAFMEQLVYAGVHKYAISRMMGHEPHHSDEHYFNFKNVEALAKEYLKANWAREGLSRLNGIEQELETTKDKVSLLKDELAKTLIEKRESQKREKELELKVVELEQSLAQVTQKTEKVEKQAIMMESVMGRLAAVEKTLQIPNAEIPKDTILKDEIWEGDKIDGKTYSRLFDVSLDFMKENFKPIETFINIKGEEVPVYSWKDIYSRLKNDPELERLFREEQKKYRELEEKEEV